MGVVCYFNHCAILQVFQNRAGLCAYQHLQGLKKRFYKVLKLTS
jgi:hypothetical protein